MPMDLQAAQQVARSESIQTGQPRDIWRHIGDETVPARGTYITRDVTWPAPRFNRWTKVETVTAA